MNIVDASSFWKKPFDFTGLAIYTDEIKLWFKNGELHREDGPALVGMNNYKQWRLEGKILFDSFQNFNFTNQIILSKDQHPLYPTVKVWKILDKNKVYEQIVIPGMEEFIIK